MQWKYLKRQKRIEGNNRDKSQEGQILSLVSKLLVFSKSMRNIKHT